jgi:hypothetical protein
MFTWLDRKRDFEVNKREMKSPKKNRNNEKNKNKKEKEHTKGGGGGDFLG